MEVELKVTDGDILMDSKQQMDKKLLGNIKENLPKLVELMEEMSSHRFY